MKSRVLVLGLLTLLWVNIVQASSDGEDEFREELQVLLTKYPVSLETPLVKQKDLLNERPQRYKIGAKKHMPFKKRTTETGEFIRSPINGKILLDPYSHEEMVSNIALIINSDVFFHYRDGMNAIFSHGKLPAHSIKKVTKGMQCLVSKILFTNDLVEMGLVDENSGKMLQKTAVNQLFKFHRRIIIEQNPSLESEIPSDMPGCQSCIGLKKEEESLSDAELDDNFE